METIILASAITASILLISSVSSPKLKSAIYSLPIPITILLIGTGGHINITYLVGLVLVLLFMISSWLLHKKKRVPIIPALVLSSMGYVLVGTLNQFIVNVPFLVGYLMFAVFWLIYLTKPIRLHKNDYKRIPTNMTGKDYIVRGCVIFVLAYIMIGIKGLILGAAITFPFNGIFTTYVMHEQLPVLITEQIRNFFALFTFFLVIWFLQPIVGLLASLAIAWVIGPLMIYCISRYLPRQYKIESNHSLP